MNRRIWLGWLGLSAVTVKAAEPLSEEQMFCKHEPLKDKDGEENAIQLWGKSNQHMADIYLCVKCRLVYWERPTDKPLVYKP